MCMDFRLTELQEKEGSGNSEEYIGEQPLLLPGVRLGDSY